MDSLNFIYKRHSVRSFKDEPVPEEHLREMVKAATYAPSGNNAQNWHFVIVRDKTKIAEIARIIQRKNEKLAAYLDNEAESRAFRGKINYHTVFKAAPVLVLAYACPYDTVARQLAAAGKLSPEEIANYARPNPEIQNIAAALENLHLAAASLGYGACWMTGPTYAAEEIAEYLGFSRAGYYLAAFTALGVPASDKWSHPARKPVDEVMTIIG